MMTPLQPRSYFGACIVVAALAVLGLVSSVLASQKALPRQSPHQQMNPEENHWGLLPGAPVLTSALRSQHWTSGFRSDRLYARSGDRSSASDEDLLADDDGLYDADEAEEFAELAWLSLLRDDDLDEEELDLDEAMADALQKTGPIKKSTKDGEAKPDSADSNAPNDDGDLNNDDPTAGDETAFVKQPGSGKDEGKGN
ncbi:hypothetical protein HK405_015030, partial [Cladochytrium tenue]